MDKRPDQFTLTFDFSQYPLTLNPETNVTFSDWLRRLQPVLMGENDPAQELAPQPSCVMWECGSGRRCSQMGHLPRNVTRSRKRCARGTHHCPSPPGLGEDSGVDVESERAAVEQATREVREAGLLHLLIEDIVTPRRVQQALVRFKPHMLHYTGGKCPTK